MNTKHTPGSWVFAYGSVYREDTLHDESSIRIALMDRNEPHTTPCERDANARLIAAAPDLLAACEAALRRLEHYTADTETCDLGVPDERALALIREAILKAKGD